jgi:hypothetical protein
MSTKDCYLVFQKQQSLSHDTPLTDINRSSKGRALLLDSRRV